VQNDPVNFTDALGLNKGDREIGGTEGKDPDYDIIRTTTWGFGGWGWGWIGGGGGGGGRLEDPVGGGGGGGGQTPADVSTVEKLLENANCNKFLNAVLAALGTATGRGRNRVTFGDLFHSANQAGAFHNKPSMSWALGEISSLIGDPSLVISINVGADPYSIAVTAMHEIFHGAPSAGTWYSHFEMADAAWRIGDGMGLLSRLKNTNSKDKVPNPGNTKGIDIDNSTLFQNILESACPQPSK
jgi:hypothetical protein